MIKRIAITALLPCMLVACSSKNSSIVVTPTAQDPFVEPDVHADFCGTEIEQSYCDCAFNDIGCDALNLSKEAANAQVASQYGIFVAEQLRNYSTKCRANNGYVESKTCFVCPQLSAPEGQQCIMQLTKEDEVAYHVTSTDTFATLTIPEAAVPKNTDILDISVVKTDNGYTVLPAGLIFRETVTLTVTDETGQKTVTEFTSLSK